MSDQSIKIRLAKKEDEDALLALLPRLAEFEVSAQRNPDHLWHDDARRIPEHLAGGLPECFLLVAEDAQQQIAGFAFVTMQEEFMSHEPGSHLEAIAVASGYEGRGVGRALIAQAESKAKERGAQSMTLHVFNTNVRAHKLYEAIGFQSEMQRCIKWL